MDGIGTPDVAEMRATTSRRRRHVACSPSLAPPKHRDAARKERGGTMRLRAPAMLALVLVSSAAWAAQDRKAPTTPTNLRVTGLTPYSATLAWDPSSDNSGSFSYIICCANVSSQTVGQQFTSVRYTAGLEANRSFTLRIVARDAAGNYSKYSNSVTFTTPRDQTPPT